MVSIRSRRFQTAARFAVNVTIHALHYARLIVGYCCLHHFLFFFFECVQLDYPLKEMLAALWWLLAGAAGGAPDGSPPPLGPYPFYDYNLPLEARLDDLVSRLNLTEMVSQLTENEAAAIPHLGINR